VVWTELQHMRSQWCQRDHPGRRCWRRGRHRWPRRDRRRRGGRLFVRDFSGSHRDGDDRSHAAFSRHGRSRQRRRCKRQERREGASTLSSSCRSAQRGRAGCRWRRWQRGRERRRRLCMGRTSDPDGWRSTSGQRRRRWLFVRGLPGSDRSSRHERSYRARTRRGGGPAGAVHRAEALATRARREPRHDFRSKAHPDLAHAATSYRPKTHLGWALRVGRAIGK